jgi:hypothetical protein
VVDWTPIGTLFAGALVPLVTVERTARLQWQRERAKWALERAADHADRRAEFERETLLSLQDVLSIAARCNARQYINATHHFRAGGTLQTLRDPDDLDEAGRLAHVELLKLRGRLFDPAVRDCVNAFHEATAEMTLVADQAAADAAAASALAAYTEAQGRIGAAITRLYGEE